VLRGAAGVGLLEANRRGDAGLGVTPTHDADAGRCAQRRLTPVGGDEQSRTHKRARIVARQLDADAVFVGLEAHGPRATDEPNRCAVGRGRQQRLAQPALLDDVGGGLPAIDGVVIGDEHRAEGVLQA